MKYNIYLFILAVTLVTQYAFAKDDTDCEAHLKKPDLVAAEAFQKYFANVDEQMVERSEVIRLIEVALLAKEHVLLMGPPGNAKSMVADTILGQITETKTSEPSFYRIQMTPETTMSETHGPINPKEVFESGRIVRHYDQGMLFSRNVFVDEIFDARPNAQRNILGLLAERQHAQGTEIVKGKIETVIGATNRYLDEVYEKAGDQGPKALLDRFSFNVYVPGEFQFAESYQKIIGLEQSTHAARPALTFEQLDSLRDLTKSVIIPSSVGQFLSLLSYRMKTQTEAIEQSSLKIYRKKLQNGENPPPPYRATKYHSPRTLFKASRILRAFVVRDWIEKGGKRSLSATVEDLQMLKSFFVLSGPNEEFTKNLLERTVNPYERSQLSAILEESKLYDESYVEIAREMNEVIYQHALVDLEGEVSVAQESGNIGELLTKMTELWQESVGRDSNPEQAGQSGLDIGHSVVAEFLEAKIRELAGEDFKKTVEDKVAEIRAKQIVAKVEQKAKREREAAEMKRQEAEVERRLQAEARQARITQYLSSFVPNAFKDPKHGFEVLAEETLAAEIQEVGNSQRAPFHVQLLDQSLVFFPGEKGYRVFRDGRKEEIDYAKDISEPVVRELLARGGDRKFKALKGERFAVQRGSVVAIVDQNTFKVERIIMMQLSSQFVFSDSGDFGIEYSLQREKIHKYNLQTGALESIAGAGLNGYHARVLPIDSALANDYSLLITYQSGVGAWQLAYEGFLTAVNLSGHNNSFGAMPVAAGTGEVIGARIQGFDLLTTTFNSETVGPEPGKTINLGTSFSFADASASPDGKLLALCSTDGTNGLVVEQETSQVTPFVVPGVVHLYSVTWVDSTTIAIRGRATDGRTIYRLQRLKTPSAQELEAIGRGEKE